MESLIAFADDKELFVLVYASAACDVVLLAAVLVYYTFRSGKEDASPMDAAVAAGLLLLILLVVLVLATLATHGRFAAVLRALSPGDRLRLDELHSRPREQEHAVAATRAVLSGIVAAYREAGPDQSALDGRIDELNRILEEFPTFRNPLRELRVAAVVIGACLVLTGIAAAVVPTETVKGAVVAVIVAAGAAALTSVVALASVGDDAIRVRRVESEAGWSKVEVRAALRASNDSLGPAMNAFGVRSRVPLRPMEPVPEHRPFWGPAVALLTVACLVFAGGVAAVANDVDLAYGPLLVVAVCVAMPSFAVFVAFHDRP
jgi:hypothetical protein